MSEIAQMFVTLSADVQDFISGLNSASQAAHQAGLDMRDLIVADLAADALRAVGGAAMDVGKQAIMLAGSLEQSKVAFTTMLGSAEKADAFLRDLADFAANTPFELKGLQESSKKLLAFGFDSRDIIPIMTSLGNAVSGLGGGEAEINRVTMALGQMKAKGKVSAEEMMQLAELGIPAWDMLAKKIGVGVPEAMKMASNGAIPAAKAIEGLVEGMNAKFPNMMAAQAKTLLGAWSNLKDGMDAILTRIGTKTIETFNVTPIISNVAGAISGLAKDIDKSGLFGALNKALGPEMKAAILGVGAAITMALVPAFGAAVVAIGGAVAAAAPFLAVAAAIAYASQPIIKYWDELSLAFRDVFNAIAGFAGALYDRIKTAFSAIGNVVSTVVKWIVDKFAPLWALLPDSAKAAIQGVGNAVLQLPGLVVKPIAAAAGAVGGVAKHLAVSVTAPIADMVSGVKASFDGITAAIKPGVAAATGATLHLADTVSGAGSKMSKDAAKHAKAVSSSFAKIEPGLEAIKTKFKALGASGDYWKNLGEQARYLEGRLTELDKLGVSHADAGFKKLYNTLTGINKQLADHDAAVENSARVTKELAKDTDDLNGFLDAAVKAQMDIVNVSDDAAAAIRGVDAHAAVFGATTGDNAKKMGIYEQAIDELLKKLDPMDSRVIALQGSFNALKPSQDATATAFGTLKSSVTDVLTSFNSLKEGFGTLAKEFGIKVEDTFLAAPAKFFNVAIAIGQITTSGQALAVAFIEQVVPAITAVSVALGVTELTLGGIVGAVAIVVGAFAVMGKSIIGALGGAQQAWDMFSMAMGFMGSLMVASLQEIGGGIAGFIGGLFGGVLDGIKAGINAVIDAANFMIRALNGIKFTVPSWVPKIGGMGWQGPSMPEIPRLAEVVLATDATMAIVGEGRFKEAVLPLSKDVFSQLAQGIVGSMPMPAYAGGGGGSTTINITYAGNGSRDDFNDFAEKMVRHLRRAGIGN